MRLLKNEKYCGRGLMIGEGVVTFNDEGYAEVSDEVAKNVTGIEGFEIMGAAPVYMETAPVVDEGEAPGDEIVDAIVDESVQEVEPKKRGRKPVLKDPIQDEQPS